MKKQLKEQIEQLQKKVALIEKLEQIGLPKSITEVNLDLLNCESKYTMGEVFTLSFKKDVLLKKDNRKEYTGRGARYNRNIRYGEIVVDISTKKDLNLLLTNLESCQNSHYTKTYMDAYKTISEIIKKYSTKDEIIHIHVHGGK